MGYNLTENLFGYTLVQDILVESATTSVTFSGLNYTAADDLLLVSEIYNPTSSSSMFIYPNGNSTYSNYYEQELYAVGTIVGSRRINFPFFAYTDSGYRDSFIMKIKLTNSGYFTVYNSFQENIGTSANDVVNNVITSTFTMSSITSLTITSDVANAIGIGSRFRLYKLNATKVADITVGTATTSVDITGLNITKDSEYMLVSSLVNASGSGCHLRGYVNGNTTATNYWYQELYAGATTVAGQRVNDCNLSFTDNSGSQMTLSIANLKLTNNGNVAWQSNVVRQVGSSDIRLNNFNATSTFTASSITSINLTAQTTNAIGVGSRFQLYRMKG